MMGQLCWGGRVRDRKGGGGVGVESSFHAASPPWCVCVCTVDMPPAHPGVCVCVCTVDMPPARPGVCVCVCTVDMPPPRRDQTKKAKKLNNC